MSKKKASDYSPALLINSRTIRITNLSNSISSELILKAIPSTASFTAKPQTVP